MATIRPFRAVRPMNGLESKVAALPYDVYNRKEATDAIKDNPLSFLNIDRAETGFDKGVDTYDERVYQRAKSLFEERMKDGSYIQEDKPCFYLYELTMNGRSQTGIVAVASVDDYIHEVIKKHENTRAEKEKDRIHHVDSLNAQTGPIFLAYRQNLQLSELIAKVKEEEPYFDFVSEDGIRHRGFLIFDEDQIKLIEDCFAKMNEIYIADGHHRCASAVKVSLKRREENPLYDKDAEFNYFLSVLFADNELAIYDYNRVIKELNGYTKKDLLQAIEKSFTVCKADPKDCPYRPKRKGQFGMYLDEQWYVLDAKPELYSGDVVADLDVSLLQDYLLNPIFAIKDPKTDERIDFVGGIRGLLELERRCKLDCKVAFSMYPTSMQELFGVADEGRLMPPKSTWFEPKLRSGLFMHLLS